MTNFILACHVVDFNIPKYFSMKIKQVEFSFKSGKGDRFTGPGVSINAHI